MQLNHPPTRPTTFIVYRRRPTIGLKTHSIERQSIADYANNFNHSPFLLCVEQRCWSGCSIIRVVPARERLARTANTPPFVLQQSIIVLELCNITLVRAWVNPIERGKFAYNREEVASAIRCHGPLVTKTLGGLEEQCGKWLLVIGTSSRAALLPEAHTQAKGGVHNILPHFYTTDYVSIFFQLISILHEPFWAGGLLFSLFLSLSARILSMTLKRKVCYCSNDSHKKNSFYIKG